VTRLLLDTHLLIWWLSGDSRLPQDAVDRVQDPAAEVYVSQASPHPFMATPFTRV
jgi:PIN domain nuclease of toxin-antitoxin system